VTWACDAPAGSTITATSNATNMRTDAMD